MPRHRPPACAASADEEEDPAAQARREAPCEVPDETEDPGEAEAVGHGVAVVAVAAGVPPAPQPITSSSNPAAAASTSRRRAATARPAANSPGLDTYVNSNDKYGRQRQNPAPGVRRTARITELPAISQKITVAASTL